MDSEQGNKTPLKNRYWIGIHSVEGRKIYQKEIGKTIHEENCSN